MQEFITARDVANTVSLLRDTFHGTIILVEAPSDGRVLDKFRESNDLCRVVQAHGKDNGREALRLLRQRGHGYRLLLFLDADFWHLTGTVPDDRDIVVTDFHDIEMDMAASGAFEVVMSELADPDKRVAFEAQCGCDTRAALAKVASKVGILRYASARDGLGVRFNATRIADYVAVELCELDLERYVQDLVENSPAVTAEELLRAAARVRLADGDLLQVTQGHDYCEVVGCALRGVLGNCDEGVANGEHVAAMLRMSYGVQHFELSRAHSAIREWEERTGGIVLR